jgi:RNA polymerase sigma-70 factor (ECF subfamily)
METLPEKQRTAMQLRDFEGKTYKEIASIMEISEEQVKVSIFRARQTVKARLSRREDSDGF